MHKKAKILMIKRIPDAYKKLNEQRSQRYNEREKVAEELKLNFRYLGYLIRSHSIRKYLTESGYILGAHGICLVCGKEAQSCVCEIEITKSDKQLRFDNI